MTARRALSSRRFGGGFGAAATLLCATAAAGTGVVLAAPAQAQAMGVFLYTDNTGTIVPVFFPDEEKCFDVFKGKEAKNLTGSDVILFKDGLCSEVLLKLVPGETLNLTFNSYGFTPLGATGPSVGSWERGVRPAP